MVVVVTLFSSVGFVRVVMGAVVVGAAEVMVALDVAVEVAVEGWW